MVIGDEWKWKKFEDPSHSLVSRTFDGEDDAIHIEQGWQAIKRYMRKCQITAPPPNTTIRVEKAGAKVSQLYGPLMGEICIQSGSG